MLTISKSRKEFLYLMSGIIAVCFFAGVGVYLYSVANGSTVPDELSGQICAVDYKGRDFYITTVQYYSFMILALIGFPLYGLINLLTLPRLRLIVFDD